MACLDTNPDPLSLLTMDLIRIRVWIRTRTWNSAHSPLTGHQPSPFYGFFFQPLIYFFINLSFIFRTDESWSFFQETILKNPPNENMYFRLEGRLLGYYKIIYISTMYRTWYILSVPTSDPHHFCGSGSCLSLWCWSSFQIKAKIGSYSIHFGLSSANWRGSGSSLSLWCGSVSGSGSYLSIWSGSRSTTLVPTVPYIEVQYFLQLPVHL